MARTRLTASERTEQLAAAAVRAFAATGYVGTSTDDVARLAGVSQPYVIRLFGSKQRLFIAAIEHATDRIEQEFREAAAQQADLSALGNAYDRLLARHDLPVLLLHGFAASNDPAIGAVVRERFGRIYRMVRELTGTDPDAATTFLGHGMLLTVLAAMQAVGPGGVPREPWAAEIVKAEPAGVDDRG
ncbi:TetR/AcrR family transcriptional regulator [Micromonospora krabiensis]|uniref:Transcriptional regulator, TetR family n=1 Tax=Micromonospora krabiensis TaxID=307121 RepID=A0A1C3MXR7_9ACTN|nr:TetR/AcrR family transcriptional regulator [Micromonospora krabiensis]SBV25123.1 transcriptional regulator, TetR family [Micromonospora krabiensis]